MAALSIAIIGKNNEPIYMKQFDNNTMSSSIMMEEELFLPPSTTTTTTHSNNENNNPTQTHPQTQTTTKTVGGFSCSSKHQFVLHAALDRFEQMSGGPMTSSTTSNLGWRKSGTTTDGMFVGLLAIVEDMRIYGYYTTTKIMFMVIVEDDAVPDEMQQNVDMEIKTFLTKTHELYIEDMLNPFKEIETGGSMITSRRFDEKVTKHVLSFNQSDAMI